MPRPQKAIDVTKGPAAQFAHDLRELRGAAALTVRGIAAKMHYSASTVSVKTNGDKLPDWPFVERFVRACGKELAPWRARWEKAASPSATNQADIEQGQERAVPPAVPSTLGAAATQTLDASDELPPVPANIDPCPPDPANADTYPALVTALKRLRIWAGNPSLRDLERRSPDLPRSTISDLLTRRHNPRQEVVMAFVRACGVDDRKDLAAWASAWGRAARHELNDLLDNDLSHSEKAAQLGEALARELDRANAGRQPDEAVVTTQQLHELVIQLHGAVSATMASPRGHDSTKPGSRSRTSRPRASRSLDREADRRPPGLTHMIISAVVIGVILLAGLASLTAWLILHFR